jgi:hypothetical protein
MCYYFFGQRIDKQTAARYSRLTYDHIIGRSVRGTGLGGQFDLPAAIRRHPLSAASVAVVMAMDVLVLRQMGKRPRITLAQHRAEDISYGVRRDREGHCGGVAE